MQLKTDMDINLYDLDIFLLMSLLLKVNDSLDLCYFLRSYYTCTIKMVFLFNKQKHKTLNVQHYKKK